MSQHREDEADRPTALPVFSRFSAALNPTTPAASTSSSGNFLQVPQPTRPKTPSVRLSYRSDDNSDSHSIFRSSSAEASSSNNAGVGTLARIMGRKRATTVSGSSTHQQIAVSDNGSYQGPVEGAPARPGRRARALSAISFWDRGSNVEQTMEDEKARQERERRETHDQQVMDLLDVIDPEVSTLTTLSDVQNSLFVPALGRFVDRSRFIRLTKPNAEEREEVALAEAALGVGSSSRDDKKLPSLPEEGGDHVEARGKYYVLPEGLVDWDHWSENDKAELDDYVRHLLHSRKWKAKRTWRGFKHYVSTPLGAFVTIYASLLTFWGAAWILFIIGWLHAGNRQDYFVEICDQILTALFCVVGIGLAPFRAVDTYHMIFIAKYHRKTLRLLKEQGAAPLTDENDLPAPPALREPGQVEEGDVRPPVLTPKEQATLIYHQTKFNKSHTFYRPHATFTHYAFPLDLLIVVVCLLDFHSIFQIALGSTTWSISYHHNYKKILTSVILSFSISCNITAGLVITVGNRRTRKEEVVREQLHKAVTEEAVRRREAKKEREATRETLEAESKRALVTKPEKPYLG